MDTRKGGVKGAIVFLYFLIAGLLLVAEADRNMKLISVFKPMLIPLLGLLYFVTSSKRDPLYFGVLLFAWSSNVLLLTNGGSHVYYAIVTFLVYRILVISIVIRCTVKFHLAAFLIAIVPFLFLFAYLIDMTADVLGSGLYPSIANALVMSVLAALSLSNYIFENDRRSSWLLISSLLFVVLMFIFVIERFYVSNPVFRPSSVLVFCSAHYAFYRYVLLTEEGDDNE